LRVPTQLDFDWAMSKLLPSNWAVPEIFRARLGAQAGRPRTMVHGGHTLIIVYAVPAPGEIEHQAAFFWRSPEGEWKSAGAVRGNVTALRGLVDGYGKALEGLEERLTRASTAKEYFDALRELGPVRRAAGGLQKALQEAREAINDAEVISLRDKAGEAERVADLLYEDARNGLDYMIARGGEEQAARAHEIERSGHQLNRLAAIFLPVSAICAVFSMKFPSGLEPIESPLLFWGVVFGAFVLGFVIRATVKGAESKQP
jgi:hypothetical protein